MRQQKEKREGSYQNVKQQSEMVFLCPEGSPCKFNQGQPEINTMRELESSVRESYQDYAKNKGNFSKVGKCINRIAYFLQGLWNELIPTCFKGNSEIQIQDSSSEFYQALRRKEGLTGVGSLIYCLDICRRNKAAFIIAVYDEQQRLFELPSYIQEKVIKNYLIVPINNASARQLSWLQLNPAQRVRLHLCRFNFAGQLVQFCQTETHLNQDDFQLQISLAQFSVHDYAQFEQKYSE